MPGYRYSFFVFLLSTILIDLVTKNWFWKTRPDLFMESYFNLIYFRAHQNSGIILGFGDELDAFTKLLIVILLPVIMLIGLMLILLYKGLTSHATCLAWGLILGSGMSTMIERIKSGFVTNFILIDTGDFRSNIFKEFLNK